MTVLDSGPTDQLKRYVEETFPDEQQEGESIVGTITRLLGEYKNIKDNIKKFGMNNYRGEGK